MLKQQNVWVLSPADLSTGERVPRPAFDAHDYLFIRCQLHVVLEQPVSFNIHQEKGCNNFRVTCKPLLWLDHTLVQFNTPPRFAAQPLSVTSSPGSEEAGQNELTVPLGRAAPVGFRVHL